ncbi:MAG TPA: Gfo/Idh/MocA family oxidoreductase [Chitinophagaceae bacterium]|nr:Gfo/Idh/MocA family oxidoreductase [Chitinophagaceae bacterium]
MKKTRFFLIGCGKIGSRHAVIMQSVGELVAVCDIVPERADAIAATAAAKPYYQLADLLTAEDLSNGLAAICTPNGLHAVQSIACLKAGLHVLCEKPMAISLADCYTMMDAANAAGRKLFVVKQNRFNPPVQQLRELLNQKKLGKIYSVQVNCFWNRNAEYYDNSWHGTRALDGGTLFTQFSHFIDILYWLLGDVASVVARFFNFAHKGIMEFEDTGMVLLQFESGVNGILHYTVNCHHKNMEGSFTIFGEKGTVKIGGQYLNRIEYQDIEGYTLPDLPGEVAPNDYGSYQGSMSNHDKVYSNLLGFLSGREPLYMSTTDALKTVEIIEKIYSTRPA